MEKEQLTDLEKQRLEKVRQQHFLDIAQRLAEEAAKDAKQKKGQQDES